MLLEHLLTCARSEGSIIEIGTVTSNGQGYFDYEWTPPDKDLYTITATFLGDESYWMSWNLTSVTVGPTPPVTETPEPVEIPAYPDYTPMFAGIVLAVVVVAIFAVYDIFRKRK